MSEEPRTIMQEQIDRLQAALDSKGASPAKSFFGLSLSSMDASQLRVVINWMAHELKRGRDSL